MMSKKLIEYAIVGLCAAFSSYLKERSGLTGVASYIVPPLLALALYVLLMLLLNASENLRPFRALFRAESKIEGDWIEHVEKSGKLYYSLFSIFYDGKTEKYHVSGIAVSSDGEVHAKWNSSQLNYDHAQGKLIYTFQSREQGETECPGYAELSFMKGPGRWNEGDGFFVDMKEKQQPHKISFVVRRVTRRTRVEVLGSNSNIATPDDRERFIKAYHAKHSRPSERTIGHYEKEWGEVYGIDKDPVRRHLIYPLLLSKLSDLHDKTIVDLGCGNGGLFHHIRQLPFKRAIGLDQSDAFLEVAKSQLKDDRVEFVKADLLQPWPVDDQSCDCATSVFVLNEMPDLFHLFAELARILRPNGAAHIILTHPSLFLHSVLFEMITGKVQGKITGSVDYKTTDCLQYHFSLSKAVAPFYQHTFERLVEAMVNGRLVLAELRELRTDSPALSVHDSYSKERLLPKYLYLKVAKAR